MNYSVNIELCASTEEFRKRLSAAREAMQKVIKAQQPTKKAAHSKRPGVRTAGRACRR